MSLNTGQIEICGRGYKKAHVKKVKKTEYARKQRRIPVGDEVKEARLGKYKGYN